MGNRSSLLIPIKGSIDGAVYNYIPRHRQVVITLPKATSLNTMMFYRFKREGFHQVWVKQPDKDPRPENGTVLKIGLTEAGEPAGRDPGRVRPRDHRPPKRALSAPA